MVFTSDLTVENHAVDLKSKTFEQSNGKKLYREESCYCFVFEDHLLYLSILPPTLFKCVETWQDSLRRGAGDRDVTTDVTTGGTNKRTAVDGDDTRHLGLHRQRTTLLN
ncbi:hypothetical protein RR48_13814 [Papilio machaon]|uniref:Uncharacterized protein n=1 Tax=Papilio machaon TaxID=76193 RepID=A0A194RGL4_PAPMA|nr:hypothetical protein RR48_13814 [Papilio machaon]